MSIQLRTVEEIKAEIAHLKSMKRLREDAATVVANGDLDTAAKSLFLIHYARPYDYNDSQDGWDLEYCRGMVRNPLLVLDCDLAAFAAVVAEIAAPGPERDARAAERAIADGTAMRRPEYFPIGCPARRTPDPDQSGTEVDPWAEFDGYHYELGPDDGFQPDPEDLDELAAMDKWEERDAAESRETLRRLSSRQ